MSQQNIIKNTILEMCRARGPAKTICPSEVARQIFPPQDWRDYMDEIRHAANQLAGEGWIEVTQRGEPVDPGNARGPIRLRLVARHQE